MPTRPRARSSPWSGLQAPKVDALRCLNGLSTFDAGELEVAGFPAAGRHRPVTIRPAAAARRGRHGVPGLAPLPPPDRTRERHARTARRAQDGACPSRAARPLAARAPWPGRARGGHDRSSSPVVRDSASPLRAPSRRARACSCSTSRRARSTHRSVTTSPSYSVAWRAAKISPGSSAEPLTLVVVTHDEAVAQALATVTWRLDAGQVAPG